MNTMSYIENIVIVIVFGFLACLLTDWWKLLSLLPFIWMNSPRTANDDQ